MTKRKQDAIDTVTVEGDEIELWTAEEQASFLEAMEQMLGPSWDLSPKQLYAEAVWRKCDWLLFGGAAGGGKSDFALHHANRLSMEHPGHHSLLLRQSIPELRRSLIVRLLARIKKLGIPARYRKVDGMVSFQYENGSIIECGHCRSDEDVAKYLCFHPDHELLTEDGWKPVADVQQWDTVATVDPATMEMWYEPAVAVHEYDYDGEMIEVDQYRGVSFCVTPNHTMWLRTQKLPQLRPFRADSMPAQSYIPTTARWGRQRMPHDLVFASDGNNGRTLTFDAKTFAEFLGWWCSEGSVSPGRWAVTLHQFKPEGRAQIENLLDRMGVNWWVSGGAYSFSSKALVQWLTAECGSMAREKHLPARLVRHWPAELLDIFLAAYTAGDGTSYRDDTYRIIVTSSKRMQDELGIVGFKAGWHVSFSETPGQSVNGYPVHGPMYRVTMYPPKELSTSVRPEHVKRVRYKGKVHCVTVPPHHTLVTRRHNRVCITGNSAEYDCIIIDEATTLTDSQILQLQARLRTTREKAATGIKPHLGLFTNPGGQSHAWMYDMMVTPTDYGRKIVVFDVSQGFDKAWAVREYEAPIDPRSATGDELYDVLIPWMENLQIERDPMTQIVVGFVPSKATDNPHIDPTYLRNLNALPERRRRQLRDGDWDVFEGQFFDSYVRSIHAMPPFPIPRGWQRARGIDFGTAAPYCCLWCAWDEDGNAYIYREDYKAQLTPAEQAKRVIAASKGVDERGSEFVEEFAATVADPSVFADRRGMGKSVADLWRDAGLRVSRAKNQRVAGWANVRQYLWDWDKPNSDGTAGGPRLFIFDTCSNLLRTLPLMRHDDTNIEDLDTTQEDHALDAARYVLMVRPASSSKSSQPRGKPVGLQARVDDMMRRAAQRGQRRGKRGVPA